MQDEVIEAMNGIPFTMLAFCGEDIHQDGSIRKMLHEYDDECRYDWGRVWNIIIEDDILNKVLALLAKTHPDHYRCCLQMAYEYVRNMERLGRIVPEYDHDKIVDIISLHLVDLYLYVLDNPRDYLLPLDLEILRHSEVHTLIRWQLVGSVRRLFEVPPDNVVARVIKQMAEGLMKMFN